MNLTECEDNLYINGKSIGKVKEVLERLLNSRKEYEKYGDAFIQKVYDTANISANHSSWYNRDMPLDSADKPFAD